MTHLWQKIKLRLSRNFNAVAAPRTPPSYKIAVVGAGTAGLAAAAFLKQSGHQVALFEKCSTPRPVGAGLLLQPTGLAVLSRLDLDQKAIAQGSIVHELSGSLIHDTYKILDIRYDRLAPHLFGLGIHRGTLFSLLHDKVKTLDIPVTTGAEITDRTFDQAHQNIIHDKNGATYGPFDLVVDAQGIHSHLRQKFADIKRSRTYPYGALWGVVQNTEGPAWSHTLTQKYKNAENMIGILPAGKPDEKGPELAAFFWSMKQEDYPTWKSGNFDAWKKEVTTLWPEINGFVSQFKSHTDLTFGTYNDTVLRRFDGDGLVFIGDAAHSTSPQLGQGANMALIDAMTLDMCLKEYPKMQKALTRYTKERKQHVHFYQSASRQLTPFFQGSTKTASALRDWALGPLCRAPYLKKEMAKTLSGIKTGPFSQINPGKWGKKYDTKVRHHP